MLHLPSVGDRREEAAEGSDSSTRGAGEGPVPGYRRQGPSDEAGVVGQGLRQARRRVGSDDLPMGEWEEQTTARSEGQVVGYPGSRKREALQRLGLAEPKAAPAAKSTSRQRKRGMFKQTAEEMIQSLLKGERG